jgi:hypothetical protein
LPEEIAQQGRGLGFTQAADDFGAMMTGLARKHPRPMLDAAALGIIGAVIQPAQPGMGDGRRPKTAAATRMTCISAWAVGSFNCSTRLPSAAITAPSHTNTAPTGTSPRRAAAWA